GERTFVALHVGLDHPRGEQRLLAALDRNVDGDEVGDRLRLAVLEDLKVFLLEIADVVALRVRHEHVDFDVVDRDAERRRLRRLSLARRLLAVDAGAAEKREHESGPYVSRHAGIMPQSPAI